MMELHIASLYTTFPPSQSLYTCFYGWSSNEKGPSDQIPALSFSTYVKLTSQKSVSPLKLQMLISTLPHCIEWIKALLSTSRSSLHILSHEEVVDSKKLWAKFCKITSCTSYLVVENGDIYSTIEFWYLVVMISG